MTIHISHERLTLFILIHSHSQVRPIIIQSGNIYG